MRENLVITAAHIGMFNINKRRHIIVVAKSNPVGQIPKINQKVIGGLRNGCFISIIGSDKRHNGWIASGIKALTINRRIIIGIPAYEEAAVIKRGNGRLILTAGRCAVHQKLWSDHAAIIRVDLSANVIRGAVAVTTVIAPGNDKTTILQADYFRLILR